MRYGVTYYWLDDSYNEAKTRIYYAYLDLSQPPIVAPLQAISSASLYAANVWSTMPLHVGDPNEAALSSIVAVYENAIMRVPIPEYMAYSLPELELAYRNLIIEAIAPIADAIGAGNLLGVL